MSGLSEWKNYKRIADNKKISARLVLMGDQKMMEVKEPVMGEFHCPHCQELLTQSDTGAFPNFIFEPKLFHERHKPI